MNERCTSVDVNDVKKKKSFLLTMGVIVLSVACSSFAQAEIGAANVLDKAYGALNHKGNCWVANFEEQRYCMVVDRADWVETAKGPRLYVLAVGEATDNDGMLNAGHVTAGLIGAFVVAEHQGEIEWIASNAALPVGSFGLPPSGWHLLKLGANDFWGWQNIAGFTGQGYSYSQFSILAPEGARIVEIGGFAAGYSDAGACVNNVCTTIEAELRVDASHPDDPVYPLIISLKGEDKGKPLTPSEWTVFYDRELRLYVAPQQWPLTDYGG